MMLRVPRQGTIMIVVTRVKITPQALYKHWPWLPCIRWSDTNLVRRALCQMGLMNDQGEVSCFCLWKEQGLEGKKTEVNYKKKEVGWGRGNRWVSGQDRAAPVLTLCCFMVSTSARLFVVWLGWGEWLFKKDPHIR